MADLPEWAGLPSSVLQLGPPAPTNGQVPIFNSTTGKFAPGSITPSYQPSIISRFDPNEIQGVANPGQWRLNGTRRVIPFTGHLHDIAVMWAAGQAGNIDVAVYDTGDAAAGSRTKLWESGNIAIAGDAGWQIIADPNLALSEGQQIDLVFECDAGVNMGRFGNGGYTDAQALLPASYLATAVGAAPKLNWTFNQGGGPLAPLPAAAVEANLVVTANEWAIIARVA